MKLHEKLLKLRKEKNLTQEDLAEKLGVSRQAISRWEMGTALPDTENILQLSKLYEVCTDYLLNDEYESDKDIPVVKKVQWDMAEESNRKSTFAYFMILSGMIAFVLLSTAIRHKTDLMLMSLAFSAIELALHEFIQGRIDHQYRSTRSSLFRKRFYIAYVWLFTYFVLRYFAIILAGTATLSLGINILLVVLYLLIATVYTAISSDNWKA